MKFSLAALALVCFSRHVTSQETERKGESQAIAYDCVVERDETKVCMFDTKYIDLNDGSDIEILFADSDIKSTCYNGRPWVPPGSEATEKELILISDNSDDGWSGGCTNEARELNMIRVTDENGLSAIYGSLTVGSEICEFGPDGLGLTTLKCKPQSSFPDGTDDDSDDEPVNATSLRSRTEATPPAVKVNQTRGGNNNRALYNDLGDNLDLMVAWTTTAECEAAGEPMGCTLSSFTKSNINAKISLSVVATNAAFKWSGIQTRLRLVHKYHEFSFPEQSSYKKTLNLLSAWPNAAYYNRQLYGADIVTMMVGDGDGQYCGTGYVGPNFYNMYSVINARCAVGTYVMAHEISHNMGCRHDRGTEGQCRDIFNKNYGFRNSYDVKIDGKLIDVSYRTVMAYDCKKDECDFVRKTGGCPRVQRFSQGEYGDYMFGASNNAAVINANRKKVAGYYTAI